MFRILNFLTFFQFLKTEKSAFSVNFPHHETLSTDLEINQPISTLNRTSGYQLPTIVADANSMSTHSRKMSACRVRAHPRWRSRTIEQEGEKLLLIFGEAKTSVLLRLSNSVPSMLIDWARFCMRKISHPANVHNHQCDLIRLLKTAQTLIVHSRCCEYFIIIPFFGILREYLSFFF
jgi:hypothetical protein